MREGDPKFHPHEWTFILGESIVKRDLVSLCGRLGVEFPGRRLESLSEYTLAQSLAEIVLDEPGPDRDLILERLRTSNQMLSDQVRDMTVDHLRGAVQDPAAWPQTASPGRLLWVLGTDMRGGVRKLTLEFSDFLASSRELLEGGPMPARAGPGFKDAVTEMREATEKLTELASQERRRADRDGRRIRDLEAQVGELRKQAAERDERLAARKSELETARGETQKALRELEAARGRLKAQPPESWESERRRLEHEVKALAAKLEEERAALRAALEAAQRSAQEELAGERSRTESARRDAEAARKETTWLRDKLKTPVPPPAPVPRDPERVAIFAEVQSLYYLAVARRSRIDYRQAFDRCLQGRRLGRALAYIVEVPGTDPSGFKQMLHGQGFQVRSKPGRHPSVWTSGLEADLRDAARSCGRISICTANPELAGTIGALAADGVHVTLVSFDDPVVAPLRQAATEFAPIDAAMLMPLPAR